MVKTPLWEAEWDMTEELASCLIQQQFPNLTQFPVKRIGYGWDNTVFQVGKEYVFRFPRRKAAVPLIEKEGRVLPKLQSYLSISYSFPVFYGIGNVDYPFPFLGYSFLSGSSPIGLSDEVRAQSASNLSAFLRGLHQFPVSEAMELGTPIDHRGLTDIISRKEKMIGFLSSLKNNMSKDEFQMISDYLNDLSLDQIKEQEVLLHGDLHFKNLLVDETGRVTGILDWGDLNIGHPGCDLSIAYSFLPASVRSSFFDEYGDVDEDTQLLARLIAVYIPMLLWMQAIDENDERMAHEAKTIIQRALSN